MTIHYNKLHAQSKQGKTSDISEPIFFVLILNLILLKSDWKKVKHRMVESMSSSTADALGLSRAILCNGKTKGKALSIHGCSCFL